MASKARFNQPMSASSSSTNNAAKNTRVSVGASGQQHSWLYNAHSLLAGP